MPALPRRSAHWCLLGALTLLALSVACRLDMLIKPTSLPRPVLTLTPAEIEDTARAHSDDVRTADVSITNSGAGTFTWSASDRASWIQLEPREGEVPGTLRISLDPDDLGPGIYEADVTVIAKTPADSQVGTIAVRFVVERPGLNVSPTLIERTTRIGSNETFTETIQVRNSGTGQLNWTASDNKSWISLGTSSGSGDGTVPVTISSIGLERGTYRGEVVITSPGAVGSPATVDITLLVVSPGLAVTPSSIDESAPASSTTPVTRTLRVSNSGNGTLTWSATKTQVWLTLSRTSGAAPPSTDVTVTLNPTGLPPGIHRDTVVFTSPDVTSGPLKIPVEFEIMQPGLVVTPSSISATVESNDDKKSFPLAITNSAGGALAWLASADAPWIALSAFAGLAPSTLTVTVDPQGLGAGTHTGTVTVSAPGAVVGSPATIPVQLVITKKACNEISISPDEVKAGTLDANDCEAPHRPGHLANLYSLSANAGDTLSIRLESSEFDAYVILTDGSGNLLAQNDDCPGETNACIRQFPVTTSGRYLIEATSKFAGARGALTITVLRERPPGTPQELRQLRPNGNNNIDVGATISETEVVISAKINDPNLTDAVRLEVELRPTSSPFTAPTHQSDLVPAGGGGTTVTVRAGGLANNTSYHWRARTCDRTARCSDWISFGNNAETAADFTVAGPGGSPLRPE